MWFTPYYDREFVSIRDTTVRVEVEDQFNTYDKWTADEGMANR